LTVEKNIPLRDVRELGVGSEFPNAENKTRAQRKENRRVDVKIYALNLNGQPGNASMNPTTPNEMNRTTPQATGNSDRLNRTTPQPSTPPPSNPPEL
jgi:hypothetical protein